MGAISGWAGSIREASASAMLIALANVFKWRSNGLLAKPHIICNAAASFQREFNMNQLYSGVCVKNDHLLDAMLSTARGPSDQAASLYHKIHTYAG